MLYEGSLFCIWIIHHSWLKIWDLSYGKYLKQKNLSDLILNNINFGVFNQNLKQDCKCIRWLTKNEGLSILGMFL